MEKLNVYEIVTKIIGDIEPVGSSHIDVIRFENLEKFTELTDIMLTEIDRIAHENKDRVEYSMKKSGQFCSHFLDKIGIVE